jgi:transposase-like protein
MEFEKVFASEGQCLDYLKHIKYKDGIYLCPICKSNKSWRVRRTAYECAQCHHQASILSGTFFQDTHKPLSVWFRAMWYITSQKNGASALGIQRILGLGSYKTAWTWLHKLRRAMVRPGRDKLSGMVEVDEAFFGAPEVGGKRGRGGENKVQAAIAVEIDHNQVGCIRIGIIEDASRASLHAFIQETVEPESTVITDGWSGYYGIEEIGYKHKIEEKNAESEFLPHVHLVISLIKKWLIGTLCNHTCKMAKSVF